MPIINFSNPLTVFIAMILFLLTLYLAKEIKKSWVMGIMLFVFTGLLIGHTVEFITITEQTQEMFKAITTSATVDFVFIFLSFITYLWIDDIEVKAGKKKSIDNSLDWFWNKV